jgi:hypothetical protein
MQPLLKWLAQDKQNGQHHLREGQPEVVAEIAGGKGTLMTSKVPRNFDKEQGVEEEAQEEEEEDDNGDTVTTTGLRVKKTLRKALTHGRF